MPQDKAVIRLAQYRPFERDGLDARGAIADLVLAAALEDAGRLPSLAECRNSCKALWGLDVEMDELRTVFEELRAAGRIEKTNGAYELSTEATDELKARLQASEEIEQRAIDEWERTVRSLHPDLSLTELAELRDDLDAWLQRLIARHGVESALILYPEDPRAQKLFEDIESDGLNFLPRRGEELEAVREQALWLFVRQPTEAQRIILANLLNTAYILTILTLDPSASQLVQDVTAGQRVYLDTNFCYRVLNLQGPRLHLSAKRLLEMTQKLGYDTAVSPWTVAELKWSLRRARDFLMSRPIPPGELAELAASATTDENFVTAYWRRLKEHPVSVKDFFDFYEQIEEHLADYGVSVVDEGIKAVDADRNSINEQLSIIENALGAAYRADPVKEHDVKHRLLVQRLRGSSNRRFSNARCWFLTCDSLLPRYDHAAGRETGELPFCVSAGAWAQVMRSFTPRTADFDQTLADMLASPYIRYRGRISYKAVADVVARIDLYEGATPELATKVLLDTALLHDVEATPEEEERQEKIHNAIVAAAAERETELAAAHEREAAEREARRKVEAASKALEKELGEKQAREDALAAQLEEERRLREEEQRLREESEERAQAAAAEELDRRDREAKELAARLSETEEEVKGLREGRRRTWQNVAAIAGIVAAAAIIVIPLALGAVTGGWPITLLIVGAFAIAGAGLGPKFGHKRVAVVLLTLGAVLEIVVSLHDVFSD